MLHLKTVHNQLSHKETEQNVQSPPSTHLKMRSMLVLTLLALLGPCAALMVSLESSHTNTVAVRLMKKSGGGFGGKGAGRFGGGKDGGGGKGGSKGGGGGGRGGGQGNAGGWPSTTGNPSGGGRSNNPPSK